jgi:hypothetical protein
MADCAQGTPARAGQHPPLFRLRKIDAVMEVAFDLFPSAAVIDQPQGLIGIEELYRFAVSEQCQQGFGHERSQLFPPPGEKDA